MIDPDSKTVVALHHAGSKRNSINYAVPFSEILKHSKLLKALAKGSGVDIARKPTTTKTARLEPSTSADEFKSPEILAKSLQTELKRIGCYSGRIDGSWGKQSMRAMRAYNTKAGANFALQTPSHQAVIAIRKVVGKICSPLRSKQQTRVGKNSKSGTKEAAKKAIDCSTGRYSSGM